MDQLVRCAVCAQVLLTIFAIWGYSVNRWLKVASSHLPMQIISGFFAFFIVMELVILPLTLLRQSLKTVMIAVLVVSLGITAFLLLKNKRQTLHLFQKKRFTGWRIAALLTAGVMAVIAVLQPYHGYDTTYYIGEVNAFVQTGQFWTKDAFLGLADTAEIPLHYALSCFYPLCAVLSVVFHVEARLMMLYGMRSLCVLLAACVFYCWGYGMLPVTDRSMDMKVTGQRRDRNGCVFLVICMILGLFLLDNHSASFMMMVRGYESKGFCAAVVAPMCAYALLQLCRDASSQSDWNLLGLIAWASMPVAMSSMAVIPVAIGIVGLMLMICQREFWTIFRKCVICVIPNMILMVWYLLG